MDIRKYFGGFAHKDTKEETTKTRNSKNERKSGKKIKESSESPCSKKRKRLVIISDSESDEENPIPTQIKQKHKNFAALPAEKKKAKISPKNNGTNSSQLGTKNKSPLRRNAQRGAKKSPVELKLKPIVNANQYFGSAPVRRSKRNIFANDDDDFEQKIAKKSDVPLEVVEIDDQESKKSSDVEEDLPEITNTPDDDAEMKVLLHRIDEEVSSPSKGSISKSPENAAVRKRNKMSNSPATSKTKDTKVLLSPPKPSPKKPEVSPTSPEESRANTSANYKKYLERAGPQALGSKTIPEGKEGCFGGLTFVITGVLESMEREEAAEVIKKYNGRVTASVSKKTSFIIAGREAGPSKIDKANKLGVKVINEDELLELIVKKSEVSSPARRSSPRKVKSCATEVSTSENVISQTKTKSPRRASIVPKIEAIKKIETIERKNVEKKVFKSDAAKKDSIGDDDRRIQELLWVDKHKPTCCKQIVGQQGDRSNMNKLKSWLRNWKKNNSGEKKKKPPPARFWGGGGGGNDDGSAFKAALLSGPPGIGKTTTASLVCKELGFNFVEFNASDTRSKRNLQEVVKELLTNKSLSVISTGDPSTSNHCLLMDEVDGMSGNEDRGGMQELIQLIKNSKIPVICMCNDRNHQKIRSLSNHCFDLRFQRPRVEQIKSAMMSLCFKEKVKINPQALQEVIVGANHDIRQIIHHLSMWSVNDKNLSNAQVHADAQKAKKDEKLNPFDTLRKVFSASDHKTMSIHDKTELFFFDYSLVPLFVQENYIHMNPLSAQNDMKTTLKLISATADSICEGDIIDKTIRRDGNWDLLPAQALYSSIIPGEHMKCNVPHQISFPTWLGKHSRRSKLSRFTHELGAHMRLRAHANPPEINMDYVPLLRDAITRPLLRDEMNGVHSAVSVLHAYDLLREDLESITELATWPGKKDPFSEVNSKVKAAFTRAYNASGHLIPYAVASGPARKRYAASAPVDEELEDGEYASEEEENDNVEADAMIKVKKTSSKSKQQKNESSAGTTSRGKGKGRGKRSK